MTNDQSDIINSSSSAASDSNLRVSVATYNRVVFSHPENGTLMLALERQASVMDDGKVDVHAHPFGGGVHILNPTPLQQIIGEIKFDSERSKEEKDFRILIPPTKWDLIKKYSLRHLEDEDDIELETAPHRELTEEFADTMKVYLNPSQYTAQPLGFVIENNPVRTGNAHARGQLSVHLYRIFEIQIVDPMLCKIMLTISQLYTDQELGELALQDFEEYGKGRINTILTLPLHLVTDSFLKLPPETRYQKIVIDHHELDESVVAILENVDVPQYQRM